MYSNILPIFLTALPLLATANPIEQRATGSTRSDTGCGAMTLIYARGTTEQGNVGSVAGPPFMDALDKMMGAGQVKVQGVKYPADIPGFLAGGDAAGSMLMATMVKAAVAACPNSAVIMSGYSQGGQLVHNAAKMMDAATAAAVDGAIIFGDPLNGTAVAGIPAAKTMVFCKDGDNICEGGNQIKAQHLSYGQNAMAAAMFAASAATAATK